MFLSGRVSEKHPRFRDPLNDLAKNKYVWKMLKGPIPMISLSIEMPCKNASKQVNMVIRVVGSRLFGPSLSQTPNPLPPSAAPVQTTHVARSALTDQPKGNRRIGQAVEHEVLQEVGHRPGPPGHRSEWTRCRLEC